MSIFKNGIGHDPRLWPMLSLLLIVVLVPTACLLWFMNRAIENERLAMRKTLEDAYRRDLSEAQSRVEQFWRTRVAALDEMASHEPGSMVFSECVSSGWADSTICFDAHGQVTYPTAPVGLSDQTETTLAAWTEAWRLENDEHDPGAAAKAYAVIVQDADDVNLAARALQAQGRCLVQSGDRQAAIDLITGTSGNDKYVQAVDVQGRLIIPNLQLMALQLIEDRDKPAFDKLALELQPRLNVYLTCELQKRLYDYSDPAMYGVQRRFLMQQIKQLLPDQAKLPFLPAEELAARYLELDASQRQEAVMRPSPLPGIWRLETPNGRLLVLLSTKTIIAQCSSAINERTLPGEVSIVVNPPNIEPPTANAFYSLPAGKFLPNWQLALSLIEGGPTDVAANRRIAIYLWTGILVIAVISILAGFMAQVFRKQMRHTRLKNDLVATVSHELKTPLSSIRLLVDTLLDNQSLDLSKTREYLQLIAKENMRLSRLIDNFLAFSRMERNKHAFQFSETSPIAIINQAVDAAGERFEQPGCRLEVDLPEILPSITADIDAMVTVVLNLLDNAYKYSGEEKRVALRAYAENRSVCIAVTDNGVGLSRAAAKKIFERFYQVDRRLTRNTGGCGLGLSIVKFIVTAHGGNVEVTSRAGQGSTFTVKLPSVIGRGTGGEGSDG